MDRCSHYSLKFPADSLIGIGLLQPVSLFISSGNNMEKRRVKVLNTCIGQNTDAQFNLASSGVEFYPLKDFDVTIEDIEINGPSNYGGYEPLHRALAEKCAVNPLCFSRDWNINGQSSCDGRMAQSRR